jgi:transposase
MMYIISMPYVLKKRIRGRTYYYLAETQRVQGKPRIVWQKYLGTAQRIQERFEGVEADMRSPEIETFELGSIAAIESIERELGFQEIVDRIVPKRNQGMSVGRYLYLIVLNRAIEPKSKASLGAWLRTTAISEYGEVDWTALDSANFWDHMEKVRKDQLEAIGDEVSRKVVTAYDLSLDCLLYDTTNYFTQLSPKTSSELARYAHSKSGKHELRHVGLALLCNRGEGIPLFHRLYPALVHDSKLFNQILSEMHGLLLSLKRGKERMTLVFDKGNNSPENLEEVDRSALYFIGTLSPYYPELCQVPLSDYREISLTDDDEEPLYAYRTALEIYGKERAVVVTYNPRTYRKKIHWMSQTIRKTKNKLQELRQELKTADGRTTVQSVERKVNEILSESHISPVFAVTVSFHEGAYKMSIRTDPLVLKEYRARFGKNIIFTDNVDWSTEEIVLAYRDRYKIETAFRWTKDPAFIRWQPMYHWTDSKIRVHGLTCVMALLYLSILHMKLKKAGLSHSLDRAMEILRSIRLAFCFYPRSAQPIRKVCKLGSTEQDLLTALGLQIEAVR